MSFKDIACTLGTELDNECIRIRADQTELGQQLTERINGVANDVKALDAKVTTRFAEMDARFEQMDNKFTNKFNELQENQSTMMHILIDIQRKLDVN
ncbi:hypothetical protein ACFLIM_26755 [Nonomuraea sp. M3C6]|uniref:Uncharacterized protein n=1 Tax=Nonomuraea marmarensis TaxID=3351344 RepID=A0ABW7AHF1_9ACTN